MNQESTRGTTAQHTLYHELDDEARATDISGYAVFSDGDEGTAHVMAHRMLDQDQSAAGHDWLGAWLNGRTGSGSNWSHLQFHMAIFELGVGDWDSAYTRFHSEILPIAATTEDALTDGPGLLWRLAITAPNAVDLPWEPLRQTALCSMRRLRTPFVELHHLLTFAGAGDLNGIDAWLDMHSREIQSLREQLVVQAGHALRAYVTGAYAKAAREFERLVPQLPTVGGSDAQNGLFKDLTAHCWDRARTRGAATH